MKSISLDSYKDDDVTCLLETLGSMTQLEKLSIAGTVSPEDIEHVAESAPFLANLTDLKLGHVGNTWEDDQCPDPWVVEALSLLLNRVTNLKKLKLKNGESLIVLNEVALPRLEFLKISRCSIDTGIFSPPSSLVSLEFARVTFELQAALDLFTSGALSQLKTLHCRHVSIGTDEEDMICNKIDMRDNDNVQFYMPDNWAQIIPRLNLPKAESLTFTWCTGLFSDDAFCIAKAASNVSNLKEYRPRVEISVTPYVSALKEFCTSSICATLENLDLYGMHLGDDGFKELVNNAPHMQCLKRLTLYHIGEPEIEMIAETGERGGWPMLEKLTLKICDNGNLSIDRAYWQNYCRNVFHPVWPDLEIGLVRKLEP